MPVYDGYSVPDDLDTGETGGGSGAMSGSGSTRNMETRRSSQDGSLSPPAVYNPYYTGRPRSPQSGPKRASIDRQEIIRKIKSREGSSRSVSPELERPSSTAGRQRRSPTPLRALQSRPPSRGDDLDNQSAGMQIERPRSALHRGDFREKAEERPGFGRFENVERDEQAPSLSTSPIVPWHSDFPTAAFRQAWLERRQPPPPPPNFPIQNFARPRAVSNVSLSGSFTYQPPTSPLVYQSKPDSSESPTRQRSPSPDKSRRHTFSPQSLQNFSSATDYPNGARSQGSRTTPSFRKESTFPYQAHQPRRSLHSFNSLPQTPALGARRPSISEKPIQHAPMVGSYEESILRGRMSTTPSKPLNFVAQIGVLGKGQCPAKLRCPSHAIVPFPAVFYSYGSGSKISETSGQPSPYVGLVDLENNLPSADISPEKRRQKLEQRLHAALSDEGSRASSQTREDGSTSDKTNRRRRHRKQKRKPGSPKAPPGGSYRIPQQGQLQIVIKNPNKTAVKLFLVPYDLSDMEPGQKTFIRQRSYSAGPIIDMPISSRNNLGTDRPEASLSASEDPHERPMLRYLIHLHICCPSKGHFYLYKSVRVVFANRVPDGKEKLRNEIQLPEPRYSVYRPGRDSTVGVNSSATTLSYGGRNGIIDPASPTPGSSPWLNVRRQVVAQSLPMPDYHGPTYNLPPTAFQFPTRLPTLESRPASRQAFGSDIMDADSQRSQETRGTLSPISSAGMLSPVISNEEMEQQEPFVFERERSRERSKTGESLLSRRLRGLDFEGN